MKDSISIIGSWDDRNWGFGCGSIDIRGHGPSDPPDMGGMVSILILASLPFIMRWRRIEENAKGKLQSAK